jgi:RNA polymerase sigma-70 factor (ECF subfamily)
MASTAITDEPEGLTRRARDGDAGALAELYARHADAVMALAYRLTGSAADAEDVLHDVFLGLPEALRRYDERGSFAPWLRRVAARTALTRVRSAGRRREVPLEAAADHPSADTADTADGEGVLRRVRLERVLDRIAPALRAVFVLRQVEGYTHAEIAALLGITPGASEVRLHRAVRRLRELLRSGR